MSSLKDLELKFTAAIDALPEKMIETADDCANILVESLRVDTPIGEIGHTRYLMRAMTSRGKVQWDGKSARVGVSDSNLLGDPEQNAPEGTIRNFLKWWTAHRPRGAREESYAHRSPGVQYPFHPWWSLSREMKEALEEQRSLGKFGGQPPKALYWWIQEEGNAGGRVPAQHYRQRAWNYALSQMRDRVRQMRIM